jgi:hypothetical protein
VPRCQLSILPEPWRFLGLLPQSLPPVIRCPCHVVHGPRPVVRRPVFLVSCQVEERSGGCQLPAVMGPLPCHAVRIARDARTTVPPTRPPARATARISLFFSLNYQSEKVYCRVKLFTRLFRMRNNSSSWTVDPFSCKKPQGSRTPPTGKMFHVKHPSSSKYDYPVPTSGPSLLGRFLKWLRTRRPWAKL